MEGKTEKLRGVQRVIAKKMTESHGVPTVTTIREVRMRQVSLARASWNIGHPEQRASYLVFTIYAVMKALSRYPTFTAHLEEEQIVYPEKLGISIAVSVGDTLVTPVLHLEENMSFSRVAEELEQLVRRAREGKLRMEDYQGGCITISNSGALGGEIFTPMLNYPESAILGVGKIQNKVVVREEDQEQFEICPMMYLCLTYDHRIINGSQAVGFLGEVEAFFKNPSITE